GVAAQKLADSLKADGFREVQSGEALLAKFGADRIAKMTDEQVREASRRVADVVVFGTAATSAGVARAKIRALDVVSGAVVWGGPPEGWKSGAAGRAALEALGAALGPSLSAALRKSLANWSQPGLPGDFSRNFRRLPCAPWTSATRQPAFVFWMSTWTSLVLPSGS